MLITWVGGGRLFSEEPKCRAQVQRRSDGIHDFAVHRDTVYSLTLARGGESGYWVRLEGSRQ